MNYNSEESILNELIYNSRIILILFQKNKDRLREIYGNKWLLCAMREGKLEVLKSSNDRAELEENGFELNLNGLFDVLNPSIYTNYKNHYLREKNKNVNFVHV